MSEAVYLQGPDETLDYSLDWSAWLGADTLAASDWSLSPADPALSMAAFTATSASVYVEGVAIGGVYLLTNTVTTIANRVAARSVVIRGFPE